jgi:hypothetical protein
MMRQSIIHPTDKQSEYKCNNQRNNQYQKVQVQPFCENEVPKKDIEGYVLVTRKPNNCNSQEQNPIVRTYTTQRKLQYQIVEVDKHSRDKEATQTVLASYSAQKKNDGDYFLAKREPTRYRSLEQTPAKSDEKHETNSADCSNNNNNNNTNKNYYHVLVSEDDKDIKADNPSKDGVSLRSVAVNKINDTLSDTEELRKLATILNGGGNAQVIGQEIQLLELQNKPVSNRIEPSTDHQRLQGRNATEQRTDRDGNTDKHRVRFLNRGVESGKEVARTSKGEGIAQVKECVWPNRFSGTAESDSRRATAGTEQTSESIRRTKSSKTEEAGVLAPTTEQLTDTSDLNAGNEDQETDTPDTIHIHNCRLLLEDRVPRDETDDVSKRNKVEKQPSSGAKNRSPVQKLINQFEELSIPKEAKNRKELYSHNSSPSTAQQTTPGYTSSKPWIEKHKQLVLKPEEGLSTSTAVLRTAIPCNTAVLHTATSKPCVPLEEGIRSALPNKRNSDDGVTYLSRGLSPGSKVFGVSESSILYRNSNECAPNNRQIATMTIEPNVASNDGATGSQARSNAWEKSRNTATRVVTIQSRNNTRAVNAACIKSQSLLTTQETPITQHHPPLRATASNTPDGDNITTNHNDKKQQITNSNTAPVTNNIRGKQHSRRFERESKTLPKHQGHNNGKTTARHTLRTLNQFQLPSAINSTILTDTTPQKAATQNATIRPKGTVSCTDSPGMGDMSFEGETEIAGHVPGSMAVEGTTRNKGKVGKHETGKGYNHNDLVTAKANSFPKRYINGGTLTIREESLQPYKHLIPISVRIQGADTKQSTTYDSVRVAYSILLALQYADPTVRLVIWDYKRSANINTLAQVCGCSDLTKDNILDFMEDPRVNRKKNSFSGRVCILANCNLNKLKQNEEVRSWLNTEGVYLTKNNLSTVTTAPAGFITGWSPKNILSAHEYIMANVSKNVPEFLVEDQWISDGTNAKIKVSMIRCSKNDVAILTKALKQRNPTCEFQFHKWERSSSPMIQKSSLIQKKNAYTPSHSSKLEYIEPEGKQHDKQRLYSGSRTTTVKVPETRQTCDVDELSCPDTTSKQQNSKLCETDEYQSLMSSNNIINLELKELREKNQELTATVTRLEQLIQRNMTTTQSILRETLDTIKMLDLQGSANEQAITEFRSAIIPNMRQEFADEMDNLHNNIDKGFSSVRTTFEQCSKGKAAPTVESQTTTKVQATTYSANSLYCIHAKNKMIDVTNQRQKIDYNKNKTTEPREVLSTSALMNLKDEKSIDNSGRQHKARHSILTRGDSKRDVTGGRT